MISRIQEIMQEKKLSPSQFAEEIGVQRSGISHLLSGRNKPSLEFIVKILTRFPDVNAAWLLFGKYQQEDPGKRTRPDDAQAKNDLQAVPVSINEGLFSEPPSVAGPPVIEHEYISEEKKAKGRKIEKVLTFFQDKTFREYFPEED